MSNSSGTDMGNPSAYVTPVVLHEGVAYLSGQLPRLNGEIQFHGKVGTEVDLESAQNAARLCAQSCLDTLNRELGVNERIGRVLKLAGFVASAPDFTQQGKVIDAASEVLISSLGEAGRHARSAIGVAQLPHGAAVEVELVVTVVTDKP
jgi:enamine deaminase RidA (YjgF/YER057c/UK114 family)